MKLMPSPALVKSSLASHSWIGLLTGALMYLICLSGTLAVFYQEIERWEQPAVDEYRDYDPAAIDRAYNQVLQQHAEDTHHIFLSLPTQKRPRAEISTDTQSWYIKRNGALGEAVSHEWRDLLVNLHLYLHLPTTFGLIVVSIIGALLCGLIISGFVAHPRIFKDAFRLRMRGSRHLEQGDIHNRLSVWGAPFHLMIAVTGAFFGLAALMSAIFANAYFDGDRQRVIDTIYGAEPQLEQPVRAAAVGSILNQMETIAPDAVPFYVVVEDVGTPGEYILLGAKHPDRLIWVEQYRFDTAGNYLDKIGFSDGEPGRQVIFSVYRIHFGHFDGFAVKVLYGILGLALTVVSVTGINIWLARRRTRDYLNNFWTGIVWGAPLALALTAVTQVLLGIPSTLLMWLIIVAAMALAQIVDDDRRSKYYLLAATSATLLILVGGYSLKFGSAALTPLALTFNSTLLITALILGFAALRLRQKPFVSSALSMQYRSS